MIKSNKIKIKLHEIENVQIGSVYIWKWIFHRGTSENIFTFWDVHGFLPQICYLLTSWLCAVVHHFCHLFLSTPFNFGVQNISMRLLICDSLWYNQRKAKTFPHQYKRRQISQKIGDKTNKMEKRRLWILEQTDKDKKYQHVWNQQITEGESKQSGAKCWGPCAFQGEHVQGTGWQRGWLHVPWGAPVGCPEGPEVHLATWNTHLVRPWFWPQDPGSVGEVRMAWERLQDPLLLLLLLLTKQVTSPSIGRGSITPLAWIRAHAANKLIAGDIIPRNKKR